MTKAYAGSAFQCLPVKYNALPQQLQVCHAEGPVEQPNPHLAAHEELQPA